MIQGKMIQPENIFVCESQMKRNNKLNTYKPCNNCLYYAWDYERNCYSCRSDLGEVKQVRAVPDLITGGGY